MNRYSCYLITFASLRLITLKNNFVHKCAYGFYLSTYSVLWLVSPWNYSCWVGEVIRCSLCWRVIFSQIKTNQIRALERNLIMQVQLGIYYYCSCITSLHSAKEWINYEWSMCSCRQIKFTWYFILVKMIFLHFTFKNKRCSNGYFVMVIKKNNLINNIANEIIGRYSQNKITFVLLYKNAKKKQTA